MSVAVSVASKMGQSLKTNDHNDMISDGNYSCQNIMSNVDKKITHSVYMSVYHCALVLKLLDQNGSSPLELLCWASLLQYVVWQEQKTEVYRAEWQKTPQI